MSQPELSVVVPVFNERDNVAPLVAEITAALRGRLPFEIVYIDEGARAHRTFDGLYFVQTRVA